MENFIIARVAHVIGVVMWIGGVAMVTTVLLPAIRNLVETENRVKFFERIEHRFARQARFTTLLTGLSGFYMLHVLDAWDRYTHLSFWWMHLMTLTWLLFTGMLFVIEPLVLKRKLQSMAHSKPEKTFALIYRMHVGLLALSLVTVGGAVAGSHGWSF